MSITLPIHNQASNNTFWIFFHHGFSNESGLGLTSHDQWVFLTRPHEADTVAFSNLSTLESVFKSLRFHRKRYIVFVWTGHKSATKFLRFQRKTHPCVRGLNLGLLNQPIGNTAFFLNRGQNRLIKSLLRLEVLNNISWLFSRYKPITIISKVFAKFLNVSGHALASGSTSV